MMNFQGFDQVEIENKVNEYRQLLQGQLESGKLDVEVSGNSRDTHARAKAAVESRDRMRAALGISDAFVDGSSFEKQVYVFSWFRNEVTFVFFCFCGFY